MRRFVHRTFEGAMKATIGADFMVKEIELGQVRKKFVEFMDARTFVRIMTDQRNGHPRTIPLYGIRF